MATKTTTPKDKGPATRESCMETIQGIQEDLTGSMGEAILLDGFLSGDPLEYEADLPHVLLTLRNMATSIRESMKSALDRTYKVL